jgi:hypothetical protein
VRRPLGIAATLVAAGIQVAVTEPEAGQAVGVAIGMGAKVVWRACIAGEPETRVRKEIKESKNNMMLILTLDRVELCQLFFEVVCGVTLRR